MYPKTFFFVRLASNLACLMIKSFYFYIILLFCTLKINAQAGGNYTYAFLNIPNSARAASLGGKTAAIPADDLNFPFHNPSLLNNEMSDHFVLNYVSYFAGINLGYVSYAKTIENIGNFAAGIHYINYGNFIASDIYGNKTGSFSASEYAFNFIYSKKIDSLFNAGINVKPVYSIFENYNSFGVAADLALTYFNPAKLLCAAIVLKNMGMQIIPYYDGNREPLPFEVQAGISQKLHYAPFRFSLLLQHLQKFDLTYDNTINENTEIDPFSGEPVSKNKFEIFGDKIMRHAIFGVEFLPVENFYLNISYNYQRRQEMKIQLKTSLVGFSWGFGFKVSKFHFSYGRASYHLAGASNHFSLSTNFTEFYKKSN